jgi:hypothetical protein
MWKVAIGLVLGVAAVGGAAWAFSGGDDEGTDSNVPFEVTPTGPPVPGSKLPTKYNFESDDLPSLRGWVLEQAAALGAIDSDNAGSVLLKIYQASGKQIERVRLGMLVDDTWTSIDDAARAYSWGELKRIVDGKLGELGVI